MRTYWLLLTSLLYFNAAHADWVLDPSQSRVNFISTKNDRITEVHRFNSLSGSVSKSGDAILTIGLASAETGIPIRNERLGSLFFQVGQYPQATARLKVDVAAAKALKPGQHAIVNPAISLDLHGVTATLPAELRLTRLDKQDWLVTSESPLIVNVSQFNLDAGLEALRDIAKLQAIAAGVPVTLALTFVDKYQ